MMWMKMFLSLAIVASLSIASAAQAQMSFTFDFEDGTDQGWGAPFGDDAGQEFPIVDIGGSNRMEVLRDGGFQEADHASGSDPFLSVMNKAMANPGESTISYDWYVDTSLSPGNYGSFLQIGTYINSGDGAYTQDFPDVGKDVELNGDQLASGDVFSGTVTETLTEKYDTLDPDFLNQTFQRLGFIINGDGADATIYFDNVTITAVPEPTSLALLGLCVPAWLMARRRRQLG